MRFLTGIIIGASLTLLVATAVDAPTNPIINALSNAWHTVIRVTGDTLFRTPAAHASAEHAATSPGTETETATPEQTDKRPDTAATPIIMPSANPLPAADIEPTPPEPATLELEFDPTRLALDINTPATPRVPANPTPTAPWVDEVSDSETALSGLQTALSGSETALSDEETALSGSETALSVSETALSGLTTALTTARTALNNLKTEPAYEEIPAKEVVATDIPNIDELQSLLDDNAAVQSLPNPFDSAAAETLLTEDVWTPFHSERSARGFARRLTEQTAYPFDVVRQGPGAYQVVFAYDSPSQRDVLLAQIATLTGR